MFLDICPNNKRDRATLEKMIMRRVRRGTTILTDKWGQRSTTQIILRIQLLVFIPMESRAGIENITFSLYIYLQILSFKVVLH